MKEIFVRGVKIHVLEEDDVDTLTQGGAIVPYVVSRIDDLATVDFSPPGLKARRLRTVCEGCKAICFIDPQSFDTVRGMKVRIVCVQCHLADQTAPMSGE
jgi:hypothetical protein